MDLKTDEVTNYFDILLIPLLQVAEGFTGDCAPTQQRQ
jgi:hypothetical protein